MRGGAGTAFPRRLACRDAAFFKPHLPAKEAWRLYSEFADRALFLDIETTGLSGDTTMSR